MGFQSSDKTSSTTAKPQSDASSSMMADVNNELMKKTVTVPQRPSDPHYIGQTEYDSAKGLHDLNSGKFAQGEKSLHNSLNDLNKEGKLIGNAQKSGANAAKDILSGNDKNAEQALTNSMKDMKENGFTSKAREDDQKAMQQLKEGHKWAAEKDVSEGEQTLNNREKRVDKSEGDIKDGLKDFNSGKFDEGEKDVRQGMKAVDLGHKIVKDPPPPTGSTTASNEGVKGASDLVHNGVMEIPSAAHLYV